MSRLVGLGLDTGLSNEQAPPGSRGPPLRRPAPSPRPSPGPTARVRPCALLPRGSPEVKPGARAPELGPRQPPLSGADPLPQAWAAS